MFLTLADYKTTIKPDLLAIVTGADEDARLLAENAAQKQIISKISTKYDCEAIFVATGARRDPLIIRYMVYITLYHLLPNLVPRNVPEIRDTLYKEALTWLNDVRDGKETPDLPRLIEGTIEKSELLYGSGLKQNHQY